MGLEDDFKGTWRELNLNLLIASFGRLLHRCAPLPKHQTEHLECVCNLLYVFLYINLKQGENSYSGGICFQLFTDLSDLFKSVIWGT